MTATAITSPQFTDLHLGAIRTDGGTQPRANINPDTVADYADAFASGAKFPPVVVFYDGQDYWLADGFHRHAFHRLLELDTIATDVRQGTRRDAVLYSVGANATHGLRRTNEDKRRSVMTLLADAEWAHWTDSRIAKVCCVDHKTVAAGRTSLGNFPSERTTRTYIDKHGNVSTMDTSNIGRAAEVVEPAADEPAPAQVTAPPAWAPPEAVNDNTPETRLSSFSGDNEWYTPAKYVDMAREVMGRIDVDPASNVLAQRTVRAGTFYTAEDSGLTHEWHGKVWMNPPYSQPEIQQFVDKVIAETSQLRATEAIVLTNNSADTAWHHAMQDACAAMCLTRGRIKFESPTRESGSPAMGQSFFYFGADPSKFNDVFTTIGKVWIAS